MEIQMDRHEPTISFRARTEHAFRCRLRRLTHQVVLSEITSCSNLPGDVRLRLSGHVRRTVPSASCGERQHKANGQDGSTERVHRFSFDRPDVRMLSGYSGDRQPPWASVDGGRHYATRCTT